MKFFWYTISLQRHRSSTQRNTNQASGACSPKLSTELAFSGGVFPQNVIRQNMWGFVGSCSRCLKLDATELPNSANQIRNEVSKMNDVPPREFFNSTQCVYFVTNTDNYYFNSMCFINLNRFVFCYFFCLLKQSER